MSDVTFERPVPHVHYGSLELAVEAVRLRLEAWAKTYPWRDELDACFAVACESPNWGLEPRWSELVNEVRARLRPRSPQIRDPRFQNGPWRP
jgi:hypothetical protein